MPSTDWLCFCGIEIANTARTYAYVQNCSLAPHKTEIRDCSCTGLRQMVGDDAEYRTPALDNAPWYDPARPESALFAGMIITNIEGLDAAPVSVPVSDRVGDGAVIGRRRYGPRVITVEGVLVGGSCCALDYGMTWLASALRGSLQCGGSACGGCDLEFLTCCPGCDAFDDDPDYAECAADYFRTLRDVALTSAPEITGYVGEACCGDCPLPQIEFQLTAGRPHKLLPAVTVADGQAWTIEPDDPACVTWSNDPDCESGDESCAEDAATCMDTALAAIGCAITEPPTLPVPQNECACEPLTRSKTCIPIPSSVLTPIWSDVVPDIELYAGGLDMRGVRVRFYPNPTNLPVDQVDPCAFCAEVNIAVIPASSTLRIDGTRRRITISCPGGTEASAGRAVTGAAGGPFGWPVLDCGVPYVACFEADPATIATDATITVRVVSRET